MQPIPTSFDGYTFRSRLEARWAVFFKLRRIQYKHEHQGFRLKGGLWYLPDFFLPEHPCFIEIKPDSILDNPEEQEKLAALLHIWNEDRNRPGSLYAFVGEPRKERHTVFVVTNTETWAARLMACRRCPGLSWETFDGSAWGNIGEHPPDCVKYNERWPLPLDDVFDEAMAVRFEHC